jgi:hypothetical protein
MLPLTTPTYAGGIRQWLTSYWKVIRGASAFRSFYRANSNHITKPGYQFMTTQIILLPHSKPGSIQSLEAKPSSRGKTSKKLILATFTIATFMLSLITPIGAAQPSPPSKVSESSGMAKLVSYSKDFSPDHHFLMSRMQDYRPLLAQSSNNLPVNNSPKNFWDNIVLVIGGLFVSWILLVIFGPLLFFFGVVLMAIGVFNANPPLIGLGFVYVALGVVGVWLRGGN